MNEVPPPVADVLLAARDAEQDARGSSRRAAFRTTRHLIAGILAIGVPAESVADLLAVSLGSVHARGSTDGLVDPDVIARLAGVAPSVLAEWSGGLERHDACFPGENYVASEILTALISTGCRDAAIQSATPRAAVRPARLAPIVLAEGP